MIDYRSYFYGVKQGVFKMLHTLHMDTHTLIHFASSPASDRVSGPGGFSL